MQRAAAYEDAFERSNDAQLLVDDDRRIVALNEVARGGLRLAAAAVGAQLDDVLPIAGISAEPWAALWRRAREHEVRDADVRLAAGAFRATLIMARRGGLHVLILRHAEPGSDTRAATFQAVADCSHDALVSLDADGLVTAVSARAALVIGYSERALLGRPLHVMVAEDGRDALDALVRTALGGGDVFQHDTRGRRRDGSVTEITINMAPLHGPPGGAITGVSVIIQDITERKRLERELRHHSERDPLTGLFNRRHFEIELRRAARLAERHGHGGAVVLLDVDRFKRVNDNHGHPCGDQLLRDLAGALTGCLRDSDVPRAWAGTSSPCCCPPPIVRARRRPGTR